MRTSKPRFGYRNGRSDLRASRAELTSVPTRGLRAFLERRRLWRMMGIAPDVMGLRPRWFERGPLRPRPTPRVWILQKNSGRRRRIKAVAITPDQLSALMTIAQSSPNHELFSWSGFDLKGLERKHSQERSLSEVHALVLLHHEHPSPGTASRARVQQVFSDREAAEAALSSKRGDLTRHPWAVITYPVGEMLF